MLCKLSHTIKIHNTLLKEKEDAKSRRSKHERTNDETGVSAYAGFNDPDGNLWLLQEFPPEMRQPGQSFYKKEENL